ncbi:aspartyl/asparaginyl beta-hydroxylase domain-containing protein [Cupriavidus sp. 30B13]|uniref:aspartyl/asparaginyl beta-hydroxylase domain-containing protein n=1 Tax=Cupriavidus sp. 30B13 TaxID=3384241 RepID=UPI003B912157
MRWVFLSIFVASAVCTHFRGKARHGFFRQLFDHSTFMAPLNGFAYLFSAVPRTPFVSRDYFPEMDVIRQEWRTIRDEALALAGERRIRAAGAYNDIGFNSFFRQGWQRFYLKWYGAPHPSALGACPRTLEILSRLPSVKAAMFARLPPGGRLFPHRDPYAGSLRYHLGLVTPNDDRCAIWVDGVCYSWRDGEDVVFDETYLHHARNDSEHDRIILFCDIERPLRFGWARRLNRAISDALMRTATSPNEAGDTTGQLNRIFRHIYAVRSVGKRLKAWNRRVYYCVKWALIAAVVLAIWWPRSN